MRIPKKYLKEVQRVRKEGYDLGHHEGYQKGNLDGVKEAQANYRQRNLEADLKALEALTKLASATGQTIEAMCRTRQEGRGM